MAFSSQITVVSIVVAALFAVLSSAQLVPGPKFPYFDKCRREESTQQRQVTYLGRSKASGTDVQFCFQIDLKKSTCVPEKFTLNKKPVVSRCCNTTFSKIKFYANIACKSQFKASNLSVPKAKQFSKTVSPTWEYTKPSQSNFTSVKYSQFGPIPQSVISGTTFCLVVSPPSGKPGSTCKIDSLADIAHPFNRAAKVYLLAIYDTKVNNYECCPTFTYITAAPATTKN